MEVPSPLRRLALDISLWGQGTVEEVSIGPFLSVLLLLYAFTQPQGPSLVGNRVEGGEPGCLAFLKSGQIARQTILVPSLRSSQRYT